MSRRRIPLVVACLLTLTTVNAPLDVSATADAPSHRTPTSAAALRAPTAATDTLTPTSPGPSVGPWRATYLPHGWVAQPKTVAYVQEAVRDLAIHGFNVQLHNLGHLNNRGIVPASDYAGLAQWMTVSRSTDPNQQIILWVSGSETTHVNNKKMHPRIAAYLHDLIAQSGADGILLDVEPFSRNNANLPALLRAIRAQLPSTWIGINAPFNRRWSSSFIAQVAAPVDALSPMFYDTTLTSAPEYTEAVGLALARYTTAVGSEATVIPSIPAYAANAWHSPAVENIETAVAGIIASGAPSAGAAVYWWWQFDASSRTQWQAAITDAA